MDLDVGITVFITCKIFIVEGPFIICDNNLTITLHDSEGYNCQGLRFSIDKIFMRTVLIYNSVIEDRQLFHLDFSVTWSHIDGQLQILDVSIDPNKVDTVLTGLSTILIILFYKNLQLFSCGCLQFFIYYFYLLIICLKRGLFLRFLLHLFLLF